MEADPPAAPPVGAVSSRLLHTGGRNLGVPPSVAHSRELLGRENAESFSSEQEASDDAVQGQVGLWCGPESQGQVGAAGVMEEAEGAR